jgi:methionine-S-sulfoxide reductase
MEQACFAAGCFWGAQFYFDQVPGVTNTIVGYTGGSMENPTYEDVCYHNTGHAEAVLVEFDASVVSYETLCRHFFRMHNPTQLNRQGPDVGDQYRSAIFYTTDTQRESAKAALETAQASFDEPIVTVVEQLGPFYEAEVYHQKYAEKTGRGQCHIPYEEL